MSVGNSGTKWKNNTAVAYGVILVLIFVFFLSSGEKKLFSSFSSRKLSVENLKESLLVAILNLQQAMILSNFV